MFPEKIRVVKNCISQQFSDFIAQELLTKSFPWGYEENVTGVGDIKPGFSNSPYANGTTLNTAYFFLYPLLLQAANNSGFFVERLLRIRVGAYVNRSTVEHNDVHVDNKDPHIVGLYYPQNSDGDTVFFANLDAKNEIFRVAPEKGTIVFFDGSIPHASSNPTKHGIRITVNFNFIGKWVE